MAAVLKSEESDELLQQLLQLPTDLSVIERLLKEKNYPSDAVSRAGYDYAEACWTDCLDYYNERFDEIRYTDSFVIPDILSSNMYSVFELLLKYGLNPNAACDGETMMLCVARVYNEYIAADTLALLIEHGGDPRLVSEEDGISDSTYTDIFFDVMFDAFEQQNRRIYDSIVHCWFVLLGYFAKESDIDIFAKRRSDCDLPEFKPADLKDHRNYYYGISNVPGRGENWSLHIFDKRTRWEVARL